jgi:hypothetical protein
MNSFRFAFWRQAVLALSFTAALGSAHAALTVPQSETLAATYTDADLDQRQLTYQANMMMLAAVRAVDGALTKQRPSPAMTVESPAWQQARDEMLALTAPAASNMADKKAWQEMYRKRFAEAFSQEEAEELIAFMATPAGHLYFHARRLKNAEQAIQSYKMALGQVPVSAPGVVSDDQADADIHTVLEESKELKLPPDAETMAKVNAMNARPAWIKLGEVVSKASYEFMNQVSTKGELKDPQALLSRIAGSAVKRFKGQKRGK